MRIVLCVVAVACSGRAVDGPATSVPMPAFGVSAEYALEQPAAPWSLTASDGSGLVLTRVDAKAVVQGPLAFTELHLYFHNPEARVREGTFAIALPPRAAVSRFAMMSESGQWMEAEVIEKMAARRAYEDFLHRRQDPALLEKGAGNQFTARVFPIPANGDKHLVISYSQELPGERFALPLRGLPKVERVDVRLTTLDGSGRKVEQVLAEKSWVPDRDFVSTAPAAAEAIAAGNLVAVQVPVMQSRAAAIGSMDVPAAVTILVDTSASRTLGFAKAIDALDRTIAALRERHGAALALQVLAFDQETRPIFAGAAADWGARQKSALLARGPAGASDLGQALAYLRAHAPHARLVVFGDAVVTAGDQAEALVPAVKQLPGVERVDVVLSGGIRDEQLATQLVRSGKRAGAVLDVERGVDGVVAGLGERVLTDLAVEVRGASWVYPRTIASARASERVMVYARVASARQQLEVKLGGQARSVGLVSATPALVGRATAAAEIEELEAKLASAPASARAGLRADITKRSVAARVISSQTAMLVLESDADYARYGIDRKALADILEIGPDGGIVQRHRTNIVQIARPAPRPPVRDARPKQAPGDVRMERKAAEAPEGAVDDKATVDAFDDDRETLAKEPPKTEPQPEPTPDVAVNRPPSAPPPPPPATSEPSRRRIAADDGEAEEEDSNDEPSRRRREAWPPKDAPPALHGELADIMSAIKNRDTNAALSKARAWHGREPGNVLAWIAMGEVLEARRELASAARAYGSIIDLFPNRADLRRFAGERLERVGAEARGLAIDSYRRAVADRPDHMTGHRLLAYALLRAGKHADALAAILAGLEQKYPDGRFRGGERILAEDAGLIGAAYAAVAPQERARIDAALARHGAKLATRPSTRFVLYWETDANDVDFHIQDARGGHAFYSAKQLPTGGELYDDVTTGYGPECFTIPGTPKAGPYRLSISYYAQGPMGYGMGLLQIVEHDGKGRLAFEDRPYIIMADHAYVDLGTYR